MTQVSLSTEKPSLIKDILTSPLATIVASVLTSFVIAAVFFKLAGPVPISVSQTSVEKQSTFDVAGEGSAAAVPDTAEISLGITAAGANLQDVQTRANKIINDVSGAVKKLGVKDDNIKTSNYSINPVYDYHGGAQTIREYRTDITLRVAVKDFPVINQVIDTAAGLGANRINGLVFTFDDSVRRRLEVEARKQAIADAKDKAQTIASEAGIKLGKIVNVQFSQAGRPLPVGLKKAEFAAADGVTAIEPGSSEIKISVVLSYETL